MVGPVIGSKRARFFIFLLAAAVVAGTSAANAQTCVSNVPHVNGQWTTLPYQMPINPISDDPSAHREGVDRRRIGERRAQQLGRVRELPRGGLGSDGHHAEQHRRSGAHLRRVLQRHRRPARWTSPRGRRYVRLLFHRRQPRLVLRSRNGTLRPVPEHGGRPLVRDCDRRSATAASWRSPERSSLVERTTRWRSTASEAPEPVGSPRLRLRPSFRPCTLAWRCFRTATSSTRGTEAVCRTPTAGCSIRRRGPGRPRFRRLGTGATARP